MTARRTQRRRQSSHRVREGLLLLVFLSLGLARMEMPLTASVGTYVCVGVSVIGLDNGDPGVMGDCTAPPVASSSEASSSSSNSSAASIETSSAGSAGSETAMQVGGLRHDLVYSTDHIDQLLQDWANRHALHPAASSCAHDPYDDVPSAAWYEPAVHAFRSAGYLDTQTCLFYPSRNATRAEFAKLLDALEIEDALPYALAAYAMGRRAQIQRLRWRDVDLRIGAIEWGIEHEARKSRAAQRVVPTVKPLRTLLKRAWIRQGRPAGDHLVCPPRRAKATGFLHTGGLTGRATDAWKDAKLQPIGLHECRHTAATWLDAAGVSPKVASVLMGHAIPDRQPGAASITLARYTHVMPDATETARKLLDEWLAAQLSDSSATG